MDNAGAECAGQAAEAVLADEELDEEPDEDAEEELDDDAEEDEPVFDESPPSFFAAEPFAPESLPPDSLPPDSEGVLRESVR